MIAHAVPSLSTTDTWAVEEEVGSAARFCSVTRADEVAAGLEQVGGDVEVVPAVAEHLALDPDHVVRRVALVPAPA